MEKLLVLLIILIVIDNDFVNTLYYICVCLITLLEIFVRCRSNSRNLKTRWKKGDQQTMMVMQLS